MFIKNVDKILSSSIFNVITLGLDIGFSKPLFGIGALGFVGLPGLINKVLYGVPVMSG